MLAPLVLILILGICYSRTMALDLTWANFSADGGDLITALATRGVPHPGGYPLYLILARPFQFIPIGTLAFRTNLFSAVCMMLASFLLFTLLMRQFAGQPMAVFTSVFSALAFGLSPFAWGQALITEVYALHGLLIITCIYVVSAERINLNEWVKGLAFGMAAANHISSLMIYPLLLIDFEKKTFASAQSLIRRGLGMLIGLSLYLTLPLRAYFDPPINWGDASTFNGFIWLVSGKLYHGYSFSLPLTDIIQRLLAFAGLLLEQYTWMGVFLGIYGLLSLNLRGIRIPTLWTTGVFLLFAVFYGSNDSQVNLLPVWLCFAIWLAYGLQDLFLWIHNFKTQTYFAGLLSIFFVIRILFLMPTVDLSKDHEARDFINLAMNEIPQHAIVVVSGDEGIFSLWYAQLALGLRRDVVIVADGLLSFDWYSESLGNTYPLVNVPDKNELQLFDLIAANPDWNVCYIASDRPLSCREKLLTYK